MDKNVSYIEQTEFRLTDAKPDFLSGVAVVTEGESKGHGTYVNADFVDKLIEFGNAQTNGVKCRFGHQSGICADPIGTELGRFTNFRRDGNRAVADIQFVRTPANAAQIDHIQKFAVADPTMLGTSIVFYRGPYVDASGNEYNDQNPAAPDSKLYETIEELLYVDFVSDPAANPGLFSQPAKERSIRAFNNMLSIPEIYDKIETVIKDATMSIFSKNKPSTNNVALFQTVRKAGAAAFGEMQVGENEILVYPGETPAVGDPVIIRNADGSEMEAPNGTYTDVSGLSVDVEGGFITAVNEPMSQDPAQPAAENALAVENAQLKAQLRLHEKAFAHRKEQAPQPAKQPAAEMRPDDRGRYNQKGRANPDEIQYFALELVRQGVVGNGQGPSFQESKDFKRSASRAPISFTEGFDLSQALASQYDVYREIQLQLLAEDSLLSQFTRINTMMNKLGPHNMDGTIPMMDFDPGYGGTLWRSENESCDDEPTGEFTPTNRFIQYTPIRYEFQLCPVELRTLWNGIVYQGAEQVPAESIIMAKMANALVKDFNRVLLFGRAATKAGSRNTRGLLFRIQEGVTDGSIPAAQSLSQGVYDDTNAYTNIEALYKLLPPEMYGMSLPVFASHLIKDHYIQAYRAAFNLSPWQTLEMTQSMYLQVMNAPNAKLMFQPIFELWGADPQAAYTRERTVFITPPSNIGYLLETPSELGFEEIKVLENRKIRFRHVNYFGINFFRGWDIVTNITAAEPVVFTPNTL